MMQSLGDWIREGRVKRGLSQTTLAEQVGASQPLLSMWERGVKEPTDNQLEKLRSLLEAPIEQIEKSMPATEKPVVSRKRGRKPGAARTLPSIKSVEPVRLARDEVGLLLQLSNCQQLPFARLVIQELERSFLYKWRPVGDNEANFGLINIGSDPGHALIERVTNALDAVLEREALRRMGPTPVRSPASPREASELWFGVPGGRISNLPNAMARHPLADQVVLTLLESERKRRPAIMIRDRGVGLTPSLIPKTILSLSGTNKIDKPYLAGAYGQGGSTVLAFSPEGAIFVSRRQPDLLSPNEADLVAITFAHYEELDPARNKNGRYSYLVTPANEVPRVPAAILEFEPGTSVVHFDLAIDQYSARMTQLTGSLWWLLQNSLFDPVLPFWVEDRRSSVIGSDKELERRTIAGNFTRLTDDRRERVEHSDSVDVTLDFKGSATSVKVNYWVVRQKEDGGSSQPIDSYVDPYNPVSYTYFGQTHGTDEKRFVSERLQLPYLSKYLIIQVELDHLVPGARRELLSSTRDRLKRTSFFLEMRERICAALGEDDELIRLNDLRKEELLSKHSDKDRERMRQRFAQLMENLRSGIDAVTGSKGRDPGGRPESGPRNREPLLPLETRDEPTFLSIANARVPIPVRLDRHALLRLESDAPDGYLGSHIHAKLTMLSQPDGALLLDSRSDFRGGRARLTVHAPEGSRDGEEGVLSVFLFLPNDRVISTSKPFKLEQKDAADTAGSTRPAQVKVPEPVPVRKEDWHLYGWDENSVAEASEDQDGGKIYVNEDNLHLVRLLRGAGYQEKGITRMRNSFILYVAFFTWMRHLSTRTQDGELGSEAFEDYRRNELDRLAQTVIHSMAAGARIADEE